MIALNKGSMAAAFSNLSVFTMGQYSQDVMEIIVGKACGGRQIRPGGRDSLINEPSVGCGKWRMLSSMLNSA